MAENYFGSICLSDIPRELITTGKNGKKYLNVEIRERREPSQYGHTHYIKAYVKKADRQEGANYFIGELKPSGYAQPQTMNVRPVEGTIFPPMDNDGIPF